MNEIMTKIIDNSKNVIDDNTFLLLAFQKRLVIRLENIFKKHKIPFNKNILNKTIEENLINNCNDLISDTIIKYNSLIGNYEKIIKKYVDNRVETRIIKDSTMSFIKKISERNKEIINIKCATNYIEAMKSMIFVYDNHSLNSEVIDRINTDFSEIVNELNRNNYNFVIESINDVIKNIINKI